MKKRPGFSWLFFSLSFLLITSAAAADSSSLCQVEESGRPVHMNQVFDHVGFCGPFAFRAMLNETLCLHNPNDCELPAITQIIEKIRFNSQKDNLPKDVFYQEVLDGFSKNGIYSEKCVPFDGVFPVKDLPDKPLDWGENYSLFFSRFINNYLSMSFDPEANCFNKNYFAHNPLSKEQIRNFQFHEEIEGIMLTDTRKTIAKANKCKKRKVPALKLTTEGVKKEPKVQLKEKLKNGPVMIGLMIAQPASGNVADHAVTITNYKTSCCLGVCETKYHVLDSLGHYWADSHEKGWVSEGDLLKALDQRSPLIQAEVKK